MNDLLSGIYQVNFRSNLGDFGTGLIVAQRGTIHGGDNTYLYTGFYSSYESTIIVKVTIKHYRGQLDSIFGPLKNFNLELKGSGNANSFSLTGTVTANPSLRITLTGSKVSQLVD